MKWNSENSWEVNRVMGSRAPAKPCNKCGKLIRFVKTEKSYIPVEAASRYIIPNPQEGDYYLTTMGRWTRGRLAQDGLECYKPHDCTAK